MKIDLRHLRGTRIKLCQLVAKMNALETRPFVRAVSPPRLPPPAGTRTGVVWTSAVPLDGVTSARPEHFLAVLAHFRPAAVDS